MADSPHVPAESSSVARRHWWVLVAAVVYWCLIFALTHVPIRSAGLPSHSDKLIHLLMYLGLAFLLSWRLHHTGRVGWRRFALVMMIAAAYGALDELLQIPLDGREADVLDWLADCTGGVLGIACFEIAQAIVRRYRQSARKQVVP